MAAHTGMRDRFSSIAPKKNKYVDLTTVDYAGEIIPRVPELSNAPEGFLVSNRASETDLKTTSKTEALVDWVSPEEMLIHVPANSEIITPLELNTIASGRLAMKSAIRIENSSSASIIIRQKSVGDTDSFIAHSSRIHVGQGAHLSLIEIQEYDERTTSLGHIDVTLDRDARITWTIITLGSKLQSVERIVHLAAPGADAQVAEVFFGTHGQFFDSTVTLLHESPDTTANFLSDGVLKDTARNVFFGLIKIIEGAQKTNSFLAQHGMLLSEKAVCTSIPSLEIAANDVKASHAASVGQIDPDQIFYLMARGITEAEAKQLIVTGFLAPVIERIPTHDIKEELAKAIERKWLA